MKSKLDILFLSDLFPPYYIGGHEISMQMKAIQLKARGHKVTVLTSRYGIPKELPEEQDVYRLLHYTPPSPDTWLLPKVVDLIQLARRGRENGELMRQFLQGRNFDVVFAGQQHGLSIFPMKVLQAHNIPIVYHLGNYFFVELVRDCLLRKKSLKRLVRQIVHGFRSIRDIDSRFFTAVSEAVKKTYENAGFPGNNIMILPPRGIPANQIASQSKKHPRDIRIPLRMVFSGRLVVQKGVHLLLPMMAMLKKRWPQTPLVLDIYGGGEDAYLRQLEEETRVRDLKDCVCFKGKLDQSAMLKGYNDYDLVLVPSIWDEPFGLVLIEGMSQGLPVVGARVGGIPEVATDGEVGFIVSPDHSGLLADAVARLWENPDIYDEMSVKALERVRKDYTLKHVTDQAEAVLQKAIQET